MVVQNETPALDALPARRSLLGVLVLERRVGDDLVRSGRVKAFDERVFVGRLVGEVQPSVLGGEEDAGVLARRVGGRDEVGGDLKRGVWV